MLKALWSDYYSTFIQINNNVKKTRVEAINYFNEKTLFTIFLNTKLLNSTPSILVGLGILGTFVGLTIGIKDFQIGKIELIEKSIRTLLSGMGTAFISSVWGMGLSLMFIFMERFFSPKVSKIIIEFCDILDRNFKITPEEEDILEVKKQKKLLDEYFVFKNDEGKDVLPANIFRDLIRESEQQTQALKSFSTDLSDAIKISSDVIVKTFNNQINNLSQNLSTSMNNILKNDIIPLLDKLNIAINEMRAEKGESSEKLIQKIISDLQYSLRNMIEDLKNNISGTTKVELENLSKIIFSAGNTLSEFPNQLQNMMDRLKKDFEELQQNVQSISQNTNQQTVNSFEQIQKTLEGTGKKLKEIIEKLQENQLVLIDSQTTNTKSIENLLNSFRDSIEKNNELTQNVSSTIGKIGEILQRFNQLSTTLDYNSKVIQNCSEILKGTSLKFQEQVDSYLTEYKGVLSSLQNSIKDAKNLGEYYSNRFKIIEDGLRNIFAEIDKGLKEYQKVTSETINKYLSDLPELLSKSTKSLEGIAGLLKDIVEELTEQLDKVKR